MIQQFWPELPEIYFRCERVIIMRNKTVRGVLRPHEGWFEIRLIF